MRAWILIIAFGGLVAVPPPPATGATAAPRDVVVYASCGDADLARVRRECAGDRSLGEARGELTISSPGRERGRALVFRPAGIDAREVQRRASRLVGRRGIDDVFVNDPRKARGAPTLIPVIEGDLEPRSVSGQAAMTQVRMAAAQKLGTGRGVVVAVLDGGFDLRHECLVGRLHAAPWDAVDGDTNPQDLGDGVDGDADGTKDSLVGHGTFVASLVLAGAPDARVLPVRVLDDEGWGTALDVAEGIQHAIDRGAHVINLSLVVPTATRLVRDALAAALDAGIVVVSAAGNGDGASWQNDPRLASRVITVGAVDAIDRVAAFSVSGTHVHTYAPGVGVVGALGGRRATDYATWSGTSFAAPFVSATAAIARQADPSVASASMRDAVIRTGRVVIGITSPVRTRLDAGAAAEFAAR